MLAQAIRGDTRLVALLGHPVAHSLSPQIHNHAFARLGLPYAYVPLDVSPDAVHTAVHALRACSFAGANVTIPHKSAVVPFCDTLSELSTLTGTANTLYFEGSRLRGTTTDPEGFFRALGRMDRGIDSARVVILGNGGTARTLAYAIALKKTASSLVLLGRKRERVAPLAEEVSRRTGTTVRSALLASDEGREAMARCTLLVNCTSAGMHPHVEESPVPREAIRRTMTVFDTVYNPAKTLLLRHADEAGCVTSNGLPMLLYQALASFAYWTGVEVDDGIFDLGELQAMTGN